ncbi:MAG: hypothetical protein KAJ51_08155, partial [Thermoplasmata archaeon]|nr:hypothetical protein [Thermoplasmata archaeon]
RLVLTVQEPPGQRYTTVNGLNVTYNYPQNMFGETLSLTLMVSDGEAVEHDSIQISITDNHAPKLTKPFSDITMLEGETGSFIIDLSEHFTDPDGDPLTFFYTAEYLTVNLHENNSVTISSPDTWSGTETITFRAIDPFGGMAEGYAKIIVQEVNDPPQISKIPDIYVHYDYEYQFNLSKYVMDPDNETYELLFWTTDKYNISFHESDKSLMLLYYPESFLGQKIWVMLYVTDGIDVTTGEFWVHVTDNFPPLIKKELTDVHFIEDSQLLSAFDLSDHFIDEDDNQLGYSFDLEDNANITIVINENNTVDFSSKQDWAGSSIAIFRAEDKTHAFVESWVKIVVIPVNDAPTIKPLPAQKGKVGERWVLDLSEFLFDVDNELSELELSVPPEYSDLVIITGHQITFFADKIINDNIEIIVSDGVNNVTSNIDLKVIKDKPTGDSMILWVWVLLLLIIVIIILAVLGVIRRRHGSFVVTDVFIIHRNGILIKYEGDTLKQGADEDIISGMLTAVQAFISDSFAAGSNKKKDEWELNQLRMGGHEIMFEQGKYLLITVIYEGKPGERLPKLLSLAVEEVEKKYGKILDKWNGRFDQLKGIEDVALATLCPKNMNSKPTEDSTNDQNPINLDQIIVPVIQKSPQLPVQHTQQLPQLPPHQPTTSQPLAQKTPQQPANQVLRPIHVKIPKQ